MRVFVAFVTFFTTMGLSSPGFGPGGLKKCNVVTPGILPGGQNYSSRPRSCLWHRETNEKYRKRDTLYVKDKNGNTVAVSLTEPKIKIPLTSFMVKDYASHIHFHLYTRLNKNNSQILYKDNVTSVEVSNYDKNIQTVVLIHGYLNDVNSPMVQMAKNAMLKRFNYNVIGVDWKEIIENEWFYYQVANDAELVGRYLGDFLVWLIQSQYLDIDRLYLVGHSLGAHAAGFAGKQIKLSTNLTVPRISGLDPALPCFNKPPEKRLSTTDATFVDCIHTCGGYLAYKTPICHADFYPNGGILQPGCSILDDIIGICSHSRAYLYYAESVKSGHLFSSYKCVDVPSFKTPVWCIRSDALMGFPADQRYSGIYYLKTNDDYTYSNTLLENHDNTPLL